MTDWARSIFARLHVPFWLAADDIQALGVLLINRSVDTNHLINPSTTERENRSDEKGLHAVHSKPRPLELRHVV